MPSRPASKQTNKQGRSTCRPTIIINCLHFPGSYFSAMFFKLAPRPQKLLAITLSALLARLTNLPDHFSRMAGSSRSSGAPYVREEMPGIRCSLDQSRAYVIRSSSMNIVVREHCECVDRCFLSQFGSAVFSVNFDRLCYCHLHVDIFGICGW